MFNEETLGLLTPRGSRRYRIRQGENGFARRYEITVHLCLVGEMGRMSEFCLMAVEGVSRLREVLWLVWHPEPEKRRLVPTATTQNEFSKIRLEARNRRQFLIFTLTNVVVPATDEDWSNAMATLVEFNPPISNERYLVFPPGVHAEAPVEYDEFLSYYPGFEPYQVALDFFRNGAENGFVRR